MQKGSVLIPILIIFILIFAVLAAYFYGKSSIQIPAVSPIPTPGIGSLVIQTPLPSPLLFSKRLFDPKEKFFEDKDYPAELMNINETNLYRLSCTEIYSIQEDGSYAYYSTLGSGVAPLVADEHMNGLVKAAAQLVNSQIYQFRTCKTDGTDSYFIYSVSLRGGGAGANTYFALIDGDKISNKAEIKSEDWAYFTCNKPLELNLVNNFYYQCSGGDGGSGGSVIYRVDLQSGDVVKVISCTSKPGDTASILVCQ